MRRVFSTEPTIFEAIRDWLVQLNVVVSQLEILPAMRRVVCADWYLIVGGYSMDMRFDSEHPSKSSIRRQAERKRRSRMDDGEKFALWIQKLGSAVGVRQVPADISRLSCGCQRLTASELGRLKPNDARYALRSGLKVFRKDANQSFRCQKCEHPLLDRVVPSDDSRTSQRLPLPNYSQLLPLE